MNSTIQESNWWKNLPEAKRTELTAAMKRSDEDAQVRTSLRKSIEQIDLSGRVVATFSSCSEASRQTGVNQGNISSVCNGRLAQTGGYMWRYTNEDRS